MKASFWNERFGNDEFAYGKEPNDFVQEQKFLPGQKVLCLAEGEGRNAVWIARQGCFVTAVDYSEKGLEKMKTLAGQYNVGVEAVLSDLENFDPGKLKWDAIVMVFGHFEPDLRKKILGRLSGALKPGGKIVMEVYEASQIQYGTGGPKDASWLYTENILRDELTGLDKLEISHVLREISEGTLHNGPSSVLQVKGYR